MNKREHETKNCYAIFVMGAVKECTTEQLAVNVEEQEFIK